MRHSTRLAGCLLGVVVASPGLVGMGGFGGGREEGQPARDFSATFTDVDGTRMTVTRVTSGADASLEGDLGRGRLRVPFDNIARVTFQPAENDRERVRAEVTLREGEPVALTLRSSTTFYGRTPETRDFFLRPLLHLHQRRGVGHDDQSDILYPLATTRWQEDYQTFRLLLFKIGRA